MRARQGRRHHRSARRGGHREGVEGFAPLSRAVRDDGSRRHHRDRHGGGARRGEWGGVSGRRARGDWPRHRFAVRAARGGVVRARSHFGHSRARRRGRRSRRRLARTHRRRRRRLRRWRDPAARRSRPDGRLETFDARRLPHRAQGDRRDEAARGIARARLLRRWRHLARAREAAYAPVQLSARRDAQLPHPDQRGGGLRGAGAAHRQRGDDRHNGRLDGAASAARLWRHRARRDHSSGETARDRDLGGWRARGFAVTSACPPPSAPPIRCFEPRANRARCCRGRPLTATN